MRAHLANDLGNSKQSFRERGEEVPKKTKSFGKWFASMIEETNGVTKLTFSLKAFGAHKIGLSFIC